MKIDFDTAAIGIGIGVILINVFFHELFFGFNTPITLLALGLVIFSFYKQERDEKNK